MTPQDTTRQPDNATCAVVLALSDHALDKSLQALLDERQWHTIAVQDPRIAMAELCVQERLERSRSAWGLQRARRLALVIMPAEAPSRTSQTRELFNAVRRYLPGVAVWLYTSGELLPLTNAPAAQAAGQSEAEQSVSATQHDDEEPSRSSPATRPEPQPLHLSRSRTPTAAPRPIEQAVADERGGEVESDDVDRVTAEELHMLFERDGSEEPP